MSMHQGLDLSKFKKVSSDKKCTVLKHAAGHEIKIAHHALTPKMKEAIDKLEMCTGGKVQRFSGGGAAAKISPTGADLYEGVPDDQLPSQTADQTSSLSFPPRTSKEDASLNREIEAWKHPIDLSKDSSQDNSGNNWFNKNAAPSTYDESSQSGTQVDGSALDDSSPAQSSDQPDDTPAAPQKPQKPALSVSISDPTVAPSAPNSSSQPSGPKEQQEDIPNLYPEPKNAAQLATEMVTDQQDFDQALRNGKITPKTYSELFANKDTLPRIGSLFGLILSGAGSGLAHQPNAVMDMMTKTIANDLDAQKASNRNAQNWYQLTKQHEFQKAQMGLMGAQTGAMQAEQGIKENTLAALRSTGAAFQYLVDKTNSLPEGPLKEQAKQTIGMLYPQYQQMVTDKATNAAGMMEFARMMSGATSGQQSGDQDAAKPAINYPRMKALIIQGQHKVPGGMTDQDVGHATSEAAEIESNRAMKKSYLEAFNALDKMVGAGALSPQQRAAYVNALGAKLAHDSIGRYNIQEATNIVDGMLPNVRDLTAETRRIKREQGLKYFQRLDAGHPTVERFGLVNADAEDTRPFKSTSPVENALEQGKDAVLKGVQKGSEYLQKGKAKVKEYLDENTPAKMPSQTPSASQGDKIVTSNKLGAFNEGDTGSWKGTKTVYHDGKWVKAVQKDGKWVPAQ